MEDPSFQISQEIKAKQDEQIRRQLPPQKSILTAALILGGVGWIGLALLVFLTVPTLGPRWLMFFLVTLATSGPALPAMNYLHRRFPAKPVATAAVLVREALWVGIYADVMIWLQFGKALNFALAAFIAAGLIAIELLLRLWERSKWVPPAAEDDEKPAETDLVDFGMTDNPAKVVEQAVQENSNATIEPEAPKDSPKATEPESQGESPTYPWET